MILAVLLRYPWYITAGKGKNFTVLPWYWDTPNTRDPVGIWTTLADGNSQVYGDEMRWKILLGDGPERG